MSNLQREIVCVILPVIGEFFAVASFIAVLGLWLYLGSGHYE